jgi:hypothetical protein
MSAEWIHEPSRANQAIDNAMSVSFIQNAFPDGDWNTNAIPA